MTRERLLFLFTFFLLSLPVIAQVEVRGTVIEEGNKEPIEQATIRLLNVKDSTFISGVVSGKSGNFSLKNVKNGTYLLSVTFIGFEPIYQPLQITGRTNPVNVGKLEMSDGAIMLGEATITAKAVEVSVRNDTIEYNADSYKVTEGSMLEDLLKKMPGVEIDSEGKVTVNGKEIKKIMVDGKEFFSDDPKVASKNLPAKMVDKVQVLDKKSDMTMMTGFDDGDEETVINLTVKPGMKQGWFGNAFAGYGSEDRYEGNFMVNRFINNDQFTIMGGINNTNNMGFSDMASTMFSGMGGGRRGGGNFGAGNGITESGNIGANFSKEFSPKLVWGGNARYSRSENLAESKNTTTNIFRSENIGQDSLTREFGDVSQNTINDNIGVNFRLEWKPDTMTQIIIRPDFNYSKTHTNSLENTQSLAGIEDGILDTVNISNAHNTSDGESYNASIRLEFSRKLNNKGRTFSGSLSGGLNDSYTNGYDYSDTKYFLMDSTEIIDQYVRYDNNGYNYRVYFSWVEPLGRNNFLQATYRIGQSKRKSLKNAYNNDGSDNYTFLDSTYSKNTRNNSTEQRISLSFKAVRAKYNYTIGFNVDPSHSATETFIGDKTLEKLTRNVTNFSPMAQLNYKFDKRTNLRIDYDGRTSQPTMSQLQRVPDVSNPLNTIIGNPDLKPTYTNSLRIRFHQFKPEQQSAFMVMADGNYTLNAIVNKKTTDLSTNKKVTTYENVNGNFGGNIRIIYNTPLKNKKFSINSMTWGRYDNSNGFSNNTKITNKSLTLMERAGINYRSDLFDLGLNGNIRYNRTKGENNLSTFNYGGGANTTIYLPYNFQVESDINYSTNSGYADGYDQEELLWNASLSKALFKNNSGTIRFKIYDILQQRSNISYNVTDNTTRYSEYNTLNSYFIVHFIYRFSIFSGGASEADMRRGPGRGPGGPPPRF